MQVGGMQERGLVSNVFVNIIKKRINYTQLMSYNKTQKYILYFQRKHY